MASQEHYRKLERMYASAPLNDYYRPSMTVGEGESEIVIDVGPHLFHAAHAVHGSVYFKMLDDAAFFAVNSLVEDVFVLTVTFNVTLTRPVKDGQMRSRGRVVHRSRRLFVAESEVLDARGRTVARGSGTFMKSTRALTPDIGYR